MFVCVFGANSVLQRKFSSEIDIMNDGTIQLRISI